MYGLLLFLLLFPYSLFANVIWEGKSGDQFSAKLTLSSLSLSVDQTLDINLQLHFPDTYSVDLDKLRINLLKYAGLSEPPFALVSEIVNELPEGKEVNYQLEPLLEGIHFLSLYDIDFLPKDSQNTSTVVIISDIFEVEVTLPKIEPDFRGLPSPLLSLTVRNPLPISSENRKQLLFNPLLQAAENIRNQEIIHQKTLPLPQILGIFLFLFLLLIARMQPKKEVDQEKLLKKQAVTARQKALKSLNTLQRQQLPQKNSFEEFYVTLTNTVRKYIEDSFRIKATTQTTPEFLDLMAQSPIFDEKTKNLLQRFLLSSDQVKFAEYQPSQEECQEALKIAKQFIESKDNKRT